MHESNRRCSRSRTGEFIEAGAAIFPSGKAGHPVQDVAEAKAEMAKQQERAATAEKTLLRLRESLKDRTILPEQEKVLVAASTGAPSGPVEIWWTASDTDSFGLATQMVAIFKKSGWPTATEHFAAGGTGNGFFIAVHDRTNAPAYAASIQNAYKLIGIDMNGFSRPTLPKAVCRFSSDIRFRLHSPQNKLGR